MKDDFAYFIENVTALYEQYGPSFVAIKNEHILGVFSTLEDAVSETAKSHMLGSFIVQLCAKNPESLVAHFAGNIA